MPTNIDASCNVPMPTIPTDGTPFWVLFWQEGGSDGQVWRQPGDCPPPGSWMAGYPWRPLAPHLRHDADLRHLLREGGGKLPYGQG